MKSFRRDIWEAGEYTYAAAYGFVPNVRAFLHEEDETARDAMLVVPGGGYCMLAAHEGEPVAKIFYEQGMNVFVLTYTTDITFSVPLKKQPLNDIARAIRYLRAHGEEFRIKGKKLAICGFSAGGHVCGSVTVHWDDAVETNPVYACFSSRPDASILCYPVITAGQYTHGSSMDALLGPDPTEEELAYFSLEKNVTKDTPPTFLWQTATDMLVPVENSYLFAEACRANGVPFAHYVFPSGFHGLGAGKGFGFGGWTDGSYVMEQVELAVAAVKAGKGVNVPERRVEELKLQFPDKQETPEPPKDDNAPAFEFKIDETLSEDVGLWTELARVWFARL
ncbi:MAG: alpha/beta hydrolase [Lachnospiraceae bacterium]|nr:alpha/beta hydrolase [Lachnospiraceae bacterium]